MQLEVHMKKERNCFGFMDRAGERLPINSKAERRRFA